MGTCREESLPGYITPTCEEKRLLIIQVFVTYIRTTTTIRTLICYTSEGSSPPKVISSNFFNNSVTALSSMVPTDQLLVELGESLDTLSRNYTQRSPRSEREH